MGAFGFSSIESFSSEGGVAPVPASADMMISFNLDRWSVYCATRAIRVRMGFDGGSTCKRGFK